MLVKEHLAEAMGIEGISAGEVSAMNKKLDGMVSGFQNKQLEKEYPVMWIDAVYEKIRFDNSVKSMAVMIIKAIGMDGKVDIMVQRAHGKRVGGDLCHELFNKLKARGVEKVWLCVSDAHLGLQAAIRKCWVGSVWQRCKIHFMRNIMATIPKKSTEAFGNDLKKIWQAETREEAIERYNAFVTKYAEKYPKAIKCLEDGFEDSIQYYNFAKLDPRKISSTNTLERLNKEVRRRSRVVGIFPSVESYLRLMTAYLVEYAEDHLKGTSYIKAETLVEQSLELEKKAA